MSGFKVDESLATVDKRLEVLLKMVISNNQKMTRIIDNQQKQMTMMELRQDELQQSFDALSGKYDLALDELTVIGRRLDDMVEK